MPDAKRNIRARIRDKKAAKRVEGGQGKEETSIRRYKMLSTTYILILCCLGIVGMLTIQMYIVKNACKREIAQLKRQVDYYENDKFSCPWCGKHADWRIIIRNVKKKEVPLNFGVCQEHIKVGVEEVLREIEKG